MDARHPGANHDAFVWGQSTAHDFFKTNFFKGKGKTWLLGMFSLKNISIHALFYRKTYSFWKTIGDSGYKL